MARVPGIHPGINCQLQGPVSAACLHASSDWFGVEQVAVEKQYIDSCMLCLNRDNMLCCTCQSCHVLSLAVCADSLRNEFLAAYGHQHLLTLTHLERAGEQQQQYQQQQVGYATAAGPATAAHGPTCLPSEQGVAVSSCTARPSDAHALNTSKTVPTKVQTFIPAQRAAQHACLLYRTIQGSGSLD